MSRRIRTLVFVSAIFWVVAGVARVAGGDVLDGIFATCVGFYAATVATWDAEGDDAASARAARNLTPRSLP